MRCLNSISEHRAQLVNLLTKEQAHMSFEAAVANFPEAQINTRPAGVVVADHNAYHIGELGILPQSAGLW